MPPPYHHPGMYVNPNAAPQAPMHRVSGMSARTALGYAYQFEGRKPSAWMTMGGLCQELGKLSASGFGARSVKLFVLMSDGGHLLDPNAPHSALSPAHSTAPVDWWIQELCKKKLPKPLQASVSAIPQASVITPWIITTGNPDSTQTFVTEAAAKQRVAQILSLLMPAPQTFLMVKRGKAILGVWRGTGAGAGNWYWLQAYPWSSPKASFAHLGMLAPGAPITVTTAVPIGIGKCPPGTQYVWDPSINSYTCGYAGQTS